MNEETKGILTTIIGETLVKRPELVMTQLLKNNPKIINKLATKVETLIDKLDENKFDIEFLVDRERSDPWGNIKENFCGIITYDGSPVAKIDDRDFGWSFQKKLNQMIEKILNEKIGDEDKEKAATLLEKILKLFKNKD